MDELLRVEKLDKSFYTAAGELKVLRDIEVSFQQGEMVGIVGASGTGKSTFLHILGTLDIPTAGTVIYRNDDGGFINPFDMQSDKIAAFRNRFIGFIFQFHYLLSEFTALENVVMPGLILNEGGAGAISLKELYARAEGLLDELGIYARKDHRPGELSGGEQQRVAVARALLLNPKIVFADEPTGNLDTATGEALFKLLMNINEKKGTTFVIVTHNESLSRKCHRVLEMSDGTLRSCM
jgi:lipoprotein-releasing system ATP-binding protein